MPSTCASGKGRVGQTIAKRAGVSEHKREAMEGDETDGFPVRQVETGNKQKVRDPNKSDGRPINKKHTEKKHKQAEDGKRTDVSVKVKKIGWGNRANSGEQRTCRRHHTM